MFSTSIPLIRDFMRIDFIPCIWLIDFWNGVFNGIIYDFGNAGDIGMCIFCISFYYNCNCLLKDVNFVEMFAFMTLIMAANELLVSFPDHIYGQMNFIFYRIKIIFTLKEKGTFLKFTAYKRKGLTTNQFHLTNGTFKQYMMDHAICSIVKRCGRIL